MYERIYDEKRAVVSFSALCSLLQEHTENIVNMTKMIVFQILVSLENVLISLVDLSVSVTLKDR